MIKSVKSLFTSVVALWLLAQPAYASFIWAPQTLLQTEDEQSFAVEFPLGEFNSRDVKVGTTTSAKVTVIGNYDDALTERLHIGHYAQFWDIGIDSPNVDIVQLSDGFAEFSTELVLSNGGLGRAISGGSPIQFWLQMKSELNGVASAFGKQASVTVQLVHTPLQPVPSPAGLALFLILGLAILGRRLSTFNK